MLEVDVKDCKDCGIGDILSKLDDRIYSIIRDEYHSLIYLSKKNYTRGEIKKLIRYKNILNNLFWNSSYYNISHKIILSKIKTLI